MNRVTAVYSYNYELDFAREYKWTTCKKCINSKTGKQIKKTVIGYTSGYYIKGKFYSIDKLRKHLVKPEKVSIPF